MIHARFRQRNGLMLPVLMIFGLMTSPQFASAQLKQPELKMGLETAFSAREGLPFWLYSMHYGRIDRRSPNLIAHLSAVSRGKLASGLGYNYGAEVIGRESKRRALYFERLYAGISYGAFALKIGRFYETFGLHDSTLGTGSLIYGRNITPVPKIAVYTPGFVAIPHTNGFVSFKAYYSEGLLSDKRTVKDARIHQKYFYLKVLPNSFWFNAYGGISHNVQWGGDHPRYGQLTSTFGDYLRAIRGAHARSSTGIGGDIVNKIGNTVATYDFAFSLRWSEFYLFAYRQFYLEDTPALAFRNAWDGRWGVSIKRDGTHFLDHLVWEYINLTRQGSQYSIGEQRGTDNYYNNFLFPSGWTYQGYTIGSPFATTKPGLAGVINNIIFVQHIGLAGNIRPELSYRFVFDYSRNYGAVHISTDGTGLHHKSGRTPRKDEYSTSLTLNWAINSRINVNGTIAADIGQLYSNNLGVLAGISYVLN